MEDLHDLPILEDLLQWAREMLQLKQIEEETLALVSDLSKITMGRYLD